MNPPAEVRRVVLAVLDGLRADAIPRFHLPHAQRLVREGAATLSGRTVSPSVTAAALTSLFTGVPPEEHGVDSDRFRLPARRRVLHPIPALLAAAGQPSSAFLARLPLLAQWTARRLAHHSKVGRAHFQGSCAAEILDAALPTLREQQRGLVFLHWPDADRAGHAHGWMSPEYRRAATRLDGALGRLVDSLDILNDPGTLLIVCADHGGGGHKPDDHESEHPLDTTIPLLLAGGGEVLRDLAEIAHLLDVPTTLRWALRIRCPASYPGRPLTEAFVRLPVAA